MAWFTEQILADFFNKCEDFSALKQELTGIMSEGVVLNHGTRKYIGRADVLDFLEETANAIATDFGFFARPVIICDTEDLLYGMDFGERYKAVALHSKLEEYISWFFMIKCDENFKINRIDATQGYGYQYYEESYTPQKYISEKTNEQ